MASRYPMPDVYARAVEEKSSSSLSASGAVKSFFKAPRSYPVVSPSASKYPLPTVYTTNRTTAQGPSADRGKSGGQARGPGLVNPRASVESWDTVDGIKEGQGRN